jgi:transcription initiation factor TFIIIB Brf1 subunit/transcription initiation factor TFIIB
MKVINKMDSIDINSIWAIFDNQCNLQQSQRNSRKSKSSSQKCHDIKNYKYCSECNTMMEEESMCNNCGLIINNEQEYSSYNFEEPIKYKSTYTSYSNNRMMKMQEWMTWTNEEKNEYKLNKYIKELCEKLQINENIVNDVFNLVSRVMKAIKNGCDGPKRSRVKDGIIIICIYYISKGTSLVYSYIDLAKKMNINMKYISKADKILMELISSNKLNLSQEFIDNFFKTENPIDYVTKIIDKYKLNINQQIVNQVIELINICQDNDILLDHTPLSLGVSCFYYILNINNIDINVKMFSELYDVSMVTLVKTFNQLKQYKNNFEELGIVCINKS